jgi:hypothetical protein
MQSLSWAQPCAQVPVAWSQWSGRKPRLVGQGGGAEASRQSATHWWYHLPRLRSHTCPEAHVVLSPSVQARHCPYCRKSAELWQTNPASPQSVSCTQSRQREVPRGSQCFPPGHPQGFPPVLVPEVPELPDVVAPPFEDPPVAVEPDVMPPVPLPDVAEPPAEPEPVVVWTDVVPPEVPPDAEPDAEPVAEPAVECPVEPPEADLPTLVNFPGAEVPPQASPKTSGTLAQAMSRGTGLTRCMAVSPYSPRCQRQTTPDRKGQADGPQNGRKRRAEALIALHRSPFAAGVFLGNS